MAKVEKDDEVFRFHSVDHRLPYLMVILVHK
jgi:hypothetical protein